MSLRNRVTDGYDIVHYCEGTQVTTDGISSIARTHLAALCGQRLTLDCEKTSKPIPATCFACIDADHKWLMFYLHHKRLTEGRRR